MHKDNVMFTLTPKAVNNNIKDDMTIKNYNKIKSF